MSTKVQLVKASVINLDPNKKQILVFDRNTITEPDVHNLLVQLAKEGFKGVGVMLDGNPKSLRVIEQ